MVTIQLNDQKIECDPRLTVLEVARQNGVTIPTLCQHPSLPNAGICRLCIVEQEWPDGERSVKASCTLHVSDGMKVLTDTEHVRTLRRGIIELLLLRAPESTKLRELAAEYDATESTFISLFEPDGCILCGLCVRTCEASIGREAITCINRSTQRSVGTGFGGLSTTCIGCGSCVNVCPTGILILQDKNGLRKLFRNAEQLSETNLVACEICGTEFATREFLEWTAAHGGSLTVVDPEHPVCPDCSRTSRAHDIALPLSRY